MDARPRSSTTLYWSTGVGMLGSMGLVLAGMAFTAMLGAIGTVLGVVTSDHPLDTGSIDRSIALAVAACLAVSVGGGWLVAGASEGLVARWLAGLTTGLLGIGAGVVVLSLRLGISPL